MQRQGYMILAHNYVIRGAEIDIIAEEGGCVVFVEVKYRGSNRYGRPRESVTQAKQRRIVMAALRWLQEAGRQEENIRFDVVELAGEDVAVLKAAFDCTL